MMNEQTEITGDKLGKGENVNQCNWCDDVAIYKGELKRAIKGKRNASTPTGHFMGSCRKHKETLDKFVAEPLPPSNSR